MNNNTQKTKKNITKLSGIDVAEFLFLARTKLLEAKKALVSALNKELTEHTGKSLDELSVNEVMMTAHHHKGIMALIHALAKIGEGPLHDVQRCIEMHTEKKEK